MQMKYYEVNFDGLVGPTHLYAGLSTGNIASEINKGNLSNPKQAALQGLEKMKYLHDLGIKQAVIPPQFRPHIEILKNKGYQGSVENILKTVYESDPDLFKSVCSSSSMWTANAATISPSADTKDHKLHITPANLASKFHRSLEAHTTSRILRKILPYASHHAPLTASFGDEGAANHSRFAPSYEAAGIELFAYGYSFNNPHEERPQIFQARQSKEASEDIVSMHHLAPEQVVFAKQNPQAIDLGVFHNDVISTGNLNLFLYHELSFENTAAVIYDLNSKYYKLHKEDLILIEVEEKDLSIKEAVQSYLFNSQIVSLNDEMILIAPEESQLNPKTEKIIKKIIADQNNPINKVKYLDLRQSMRNGGGPACLRLRMVMSEAEIAQAHQPVFMSNKLYSALYQWIEKNYRDQLAAEDILDPAFYEEQLFAFKQLEKILDLPLLT